MEYDDPLFRQSLIVQGHRDMVDPARSLYGTPERLRARIERTRILFARGTLPLPGWLMRQGEGHGRAVSKGTWDRRRLAVVLPVHVRGDTRFVEDPARNTYFDTALNAGMDAHFVNADGVVRLDDSGENQPVSREIVEEFVREIKAIRPQLLFFSCNEAGCQDGFGPELINRIRADVGCHTIGLNGDAWGPHMVDTVRSWTPVCDLVYHIAPNSLFATGDRLGGKAWLGPVLVDGRAFFPGESRTVDLFFCGNGGIHRRPGWLKWAQQVADRHGMRADLRQHDRSRQHAPFPTNAAYAEALRRARMVLNLSSRGRGLKAMTGRSWQAIASGAVLLEENNAALPYYFAPFLHYIPFETMQDLDAGMKLFGTDPTLAEEIGAGAAAFHAEHYGEARCWAAILAALDARIGVH
jgi:hypothetical protein